MTNICPLSGKPITDPIVVTFYNNAKAIYEAEPLLAILAAANTRMPEGFESNIHRLETQNKAHETAIEAFLNLPHASVRTETQVLFSSPTSSPSYSPKETTGEGLTLQNGDSTDGSSQDASRSPSRHSYHSGSFQ